MCLKEYRSCAEPKIRGGNTEDALEEGQVTFDRKLGNKTFHKSVLEENLLDFFLWADLADLILLLCCHCRKSGLNTCKCYNKVDLGLVIVLA